MDVTLDITAIDTHPEFIDIKLEMLIEICKAFAIPKEMFDEIDKRHWVRLYRDGSYDVLSFE